jgi:hypothetical protein
MRISSTLPALALLQGVFAANFTRSSKRGLIYISTEKSSTDDTIWNSTSYSDLTWYYNYGVAETPVLEADESFEFVPMLFSADVSTGFGDTIKALIKGGTNITYVLSYNEPDGSKDTGGSDIKAEDAAQTWIDVLEPLRKLGIKLGAPAVTGSPDGLSWLKDFFSACDGGCTADFIPAHWYGNYEGLTNHIELVRSTFVYPIHFFSILLISGESFV